MPSQLIRDFFSAPIPEKLWHYTSMDGMRGILDSHSVWATDSAFLNDPSEIVHALEIARDVLRTSAIDTGSAMGRDAVTAAIESEFATGLLSSAHTQYFIVSFSHKADDLGQWRAYANNGRGVALDFDMRKIRPPASLGTLVTFAPCIYDTVQKRELLSGLILSFFDADRSITQKLKEPDWLLTERRNWQVVQRATGLTDDSSSFKEHVQTIFRGEIDRCIGEFRGNLARLATHFKHSAYEHECEWRLVLPHFRARRMKRFAVHYRTGKSIPYIAFDFAEYDRLPVSSVMRGPCADKDVVEEALSITGYKIPIEVSVVPFRCD